MIISTNKKPNKLEISVVSFANSMLKKLNKKKNQGWSGWDERAFHEGTERSYSRWQIKVEDHFQKAIDFDTEEDMVDVANFLMFRYVYLKKS